MYLGIDLGTSGVKALIMDDAQKVVASATSALTVSRPFPAWSEQSPDDWISATGQAIDALQASHPRDVAAVKAIGLSGQQHGATILDASDTPLRPAILWNDTRSHEEAAILDAMPDVRKIIGNIVFPGFTAPKISWVKKHEPELFDKIAKVLLPKDYLRLWLTGEYASDMSDASGTGWLDIEKRGWSTTLLSATDLGMDHMPKAVEGTDATGSLRPDLASRWGMTAPIVAGGGGDNAASAVGLGAVTEGDAFVSLGTSGVLFTANDQWRPDADSAVHAFCHAIPGAWHQMGVMLSATDGLNWFAGLLGAKPEDLTAPLGDTLRDPASITFLPYLSGERTPHNDAKIRGAFVGLGHEADRTTLAQAILEGVAYNVRDNLAALNSTGTYPDAIWAVGGGSRSIYWLKAISTILRLPIHVPEAGDFGGAFGAARLGMIAETGATPDQVATKPAIAQTISPDMERAAAFDEGFERFRALYPAIKGATE